MVYKTFLPTPALFDVVEYYWYFQIQLNSSVVQEYATPLLQGMAFNFKQQTEQHVFDNQTLTLDKTVYIFGQPLSPRVIHSYAMGIDILGVKFKPLGIAKLTGINMAHIANEIIHAEDIWGNDLKTLCDEMQSAPSLQEAIYVLELFLIQKYKNISLPTRIDCVSQALQLMTHKQGNIHIKTLQEQLNVSRKTLERAFLNYLGVLPKKYTQIIRFNAIKKILDTTPIGQNLTAFALDLGFFDSSHFISEFKTFSGVTPQTYLKNIPLHLTIQGV